jgi:hypothetical protein
MFERSKHENSPNGRELRNYDGLVVLMNRIGHAALHEDCFALPILSGNSYGYMLDTLDIVATSHSGTIDMISLLVTCALEIKEGDTMLNARESRNLGIFNDRLLAQVPFIEKYGKPPILL